MNVSNYIKITCNLKDGGLQITSNYMKKCNLLQLITITNYDYPMSGYQCTTNVVCLNAAHGEVHSIQNYVIRN